MSLKETLKTKICISSLEPNFPLRGFVELAELCDKRQVLQLLDEIQTELDAQEQHSKNISDPPHPLQGYWCFYCAQARSYYRSIIRDPQNKVRWSFLW